MKLREIASGIAACLWLGLAAATQAQTVTLDWKFSVAGNPSQPTTKTGTGNDATASFMFGNNSYIFGTGPEGLYGSPTGLWSMARFDGTNSVLELRLVDLTPVTSVNLNLMLYQFIDTSQAFFPGTISFDLPNAQFDGREVVVQQTGNMVGYWVRDTYHWNAVSFPGESVNLALSPGAGSGSLLIDEAVFTISGSLTAVPEPRAMHLAVAGLFLLGVTSWFRRARRA